MTVIDSSTNHERRPAPQAAELDALCATIADHVIAQADVERNHAALRAAVARPSNGLFGPGSMFWRMLEPLPILPFMLVQASLYEIAHPKIWFGTEHSVTRTGDYNSRFARSYDAFFDWFCGDLETALRRSRRINGYHARVGGLAPFSAGHIRAGQPYRATERELMIFTVGTQVIPIKDFYERLVGPLDPDEVARYYEECKTFAMLFGIDRDAMPPSWAEFERYWDGVLRSGELEVPAEGHDRMGPFHDQSGLPFVSRWLVRWLMVVQLNTLPDDFRARFVRVTPLARARPRFTAASCALFRTALRLMPQDLRDAPRVRAAQRRAGLITHAGPAARWLARTLPHPFGDRMPSMTKPASPASDPADSPAFTLNPV